MTQPIKVSSKERGNILKEIQKLLYVYNLNRVIRFGKKRVEKFETQSVAEHLTNTIFLAHYFRDLEDREHKMDFEKVIRMILMHDMPEIENGEIINPQKTQKDRDKDMQMVDTVAEKSPRCIEKEIKKLYKELEGQKTKEAQFVHCVDKFEGQFFWFKDDGIRMIKSVFKEKRLGVEVYDTVYEKIMNSLQKYGFKDMAKYFYVQQSDKKRRGLYEIL